MSKTKLWQIQKKILIDLEHTYEQMHVIDYITNIHKHNMVPKIFDKITDQLSDSIGKRANICRL